MFTKAERLILFNQFEILKILDAESGNEYEEKQEILSHGFEIFYGDINPSVYEETFSTEAAREVLDILDMFRALKFSATKLGYTPKSHWTEFEGFDANDNDGRYSFAHFVRRKQRKFVELADRPDNSHSASSLQTYRRMHERWQNRHGGSYELTAEQIEDIADGRD